MNLQLIGLFHKQCLYLIKILESLHDSSHPIHFEQIKCLLKLYLINQSNSKGYIMSMSNFLRNFLKYVCNPFQSEIFYNKEVYSNNRLELQVLKPAKQLLSFSGKLIQHISFFFIYYLFLRQNLEVMLLIKQNYSIY